MNETKRRYNERYRPRELRASIRSWIVPGSIMSIDIDIQLYILQNKEGIERENDRVAMG